MQILNESYRWLTRLCFIAGFAGFADAANLIVENGRPNAEIIIAEKPRRMVKLAAEELRGTIRKISGAELPISTKPSVNFPVKLYVGRSEYTDNLKIDSTDLKKNSYRMVSGDAYLALIGDDDDYVPKEPYAKNTSDRERAAKEWDKLTGARWANPGSSVFKGYNKELDVWYHDGRGSINAVYDFLRSLGVRWYFPGDFGECIPQMKTIALPDVNRTVHSDFPMRVIMGTSYTFFRGDRDRVLWTIRLGLSNSIKSTMAAHGIDYVIHHDNTRKAHPDWYMMKNGKRDTVSRGGKPCLSPKDMIQSNIELGRAYFEIYGNDYLSVMPTDGYVSLCECEQCKGKDTPDRGYGGRLSDYVWHYVNEVAKGLYESNPDKEINCAAYSSYKLPPLKIDKLSPNMTVMIAQARRTFINPEARDEILELRKGWLPKITRKPQFNLHENYSSSGESPYPMYYPHIIAEDIRSLKGISSGEYIEENCKASGKVPPVELAVNHLNIYTTACMWQDPDQNIDLVLNEYYEKFYGPAAKEMKAFIEFSEANWGKMEKNVELVNKCLELMDAARKVAGEDGIYARRVALVDSYLYKLRQIREKLVLGRKENPKVRIYDKENDNTVNIDGKLDEKFWQGIASYPLRDPATGKKPVLETRFRTAWKGGNLYFGIDCKEDDTKKLNSATMKDDDPNIWNGDTVEILLETQGHSYYQFVVNPAGAMLDADRKRGINTLWNSDAKVATHVGDGYWSMEICIPVADEMQEENLPNQLVSGRRPVAKDPWYFNVARVRVRDKTSVSVYSFAQGEKVKFHDLDKFGILSFEK